jgi:hypothetical protein
MSNDDVAQRRMKQQSRRVRIRQGAMGHAVNQDSQVLKRLLFRVIPGDETNIRKRHGEQTEDRPCRPQPRRVVVPGYHHDRDARPFQPSHLAHEVGQGGPGRPRVVEDVTRVQHEIDVASENVGNGGLEAVFDVDRALISACFRVGPAVGRVAKMRIREVGDANLTSR